MCDALIFRSYKTLSRDLPSSTVCLLPNWLVPVGNQDAVLNDMGSSAVLMLMLHAEILFSMFPSLQGHLLPKMRKLCMA